MVLAEFFIFVFKEIRTNPSPLNKKKGNRVVVHISQPSVPERSGDGRGGQSGGERTMSYFRICKSLSTFIQDKTTPSMF